MRHRQDRTRDTRLDGQAPEPSQPDDTMNLLAEAGLGPRPGLEDWLDYLSRKAEAGA